VAFQAFVGLLGGSMLSAGGEIAPIDFQYNYRLMRRRLSKNESRQFACSRCRYRDPPRAGGQGRPGAKNTAHLARRVPGFAAA
jgi:hypothetical protein